jgi:hypothetical protein
MSDATDSSYDFAPAPKEPAPPLPDLAPAPEKSPAPRPPLIADDSPGKPCPHCGFLIRGKTAKNRCPDCTGSLEPSAINLLQFAPTRWVRTLSLGAFLLVPAIAAYVAAIILTWLHNSPADRYSHLAAPALAFLGTLLVTAREPAPSEKSPLALPARLAALAVLLLWLPIAFREPTVANARTAHLLLYPILLASAAHAFFLGFHFRALAIRIPSDSLASQALNLAWIVAGLCLFLFVLALFDLARPEYLTLFMCAFPLIAILGSILAWAAMFSLLMSLQFRSAVAAADSIALRHASRAAARAAAAAKTQRTP